MGRRNHAKERKREISKKMRTEDGRDFGTKPKDCPASDHFSCMNQSILMTLTQLGSPSHTVARLFNDTIKSIPSERSH